MGARSWASALDLVQAGQRYDERALQPLQATVGLVEQVAQFGQFAFEGVHTRGQVFQGGDIGHHLASSHGDDAARKPTRR
jgi:hypothetical protein